jgi:hypothetical protein
MDCRLLVVKSKGVVRAKSTGLRAYGTTNQIL